ncbi:hypothetical protein [Thaumasiovibrio subtropicus]|nr:hypothetical protein [Thaumasiovibrio subtropicus]
MAKKRSKTRRRSAVGVNSKTGRLKKGYRYAKGGRVVKAKKK